MSIKDKLIACKSYEEARPIMETLNASATAHELMGLSYSIQEKQPTHAKRFRDKVIQEMEDAEENKKRMQDDEDSVKEADGGVSKQSSSTTGLEKQGEEHTAPEEASAQPDKKDQMGVAINEMGQYPQQMAGQMAPQMAPQGQQPYGGQHPPQMTPQQQISYTVTETVRRILNPEIRKINEAIKAIDRKVQETQQQQPKTLELGSKLGMAGAPSHRAVRETSSQVNDLEATRSQIEKLNNMYNSGKY